MKLFVVIAIMSGLVLACSSMGPKDPEMKKMMAEYQRPKSIPYPDNNKYTKAREELGKMLFFEPRLSGSQVMSCATCHNPSLGWEDGQPKAVGHGHKILGRKSPTVLNLAWAPRLFWDGRAGSLEEQALGPIEAPGEMNNPLANAVDNIKNVKGYKKYFEAAYPGEGISKDTIAKAIATFERGVVSGEAPFDRWLAGDSNAMSASAKNGFKVFNGKAKCAACHSGWSFTDHSFQDIGVNDKDIGRGKFLKLRSQQHAFKTPTLRNVTERGPYLHNGQEKTLMDVVEFYNRGGDTKRPSKSSSVTSLNLTQTEKTDLVNFMKALTSKDKPIDLPILPANH